MHVKTSLCH